jgi:hypothetical protein
VADAAYPGDGGQEDQTDNVFRALLPMIQFGAMAADIPDTGLTPDQPAGWRADRAGDGGGPLEAWSARHVRGAGPDGVVGEVERRARLADNQRRGLAGMGGRFLSTPNAWDPVEDSVAQRTGRVKAPGVYLDDVDPGEGVVFDPVERRRMLRKVYGDAATKPRRTLSGSRGSILTASTARSWRCWSTTRRRLSAGF